MVVLTVPHTFILTLTTTITITTPTNNNNHNNNNIMQDQQQSHSGKQAGWSHAGGNRCLAIPTRRRGGRSNSSDGSNDYSPLFLPHGAESEENRKKKGNPTRNFTLTPAEGDAEVADEGKMITGAFMRCDDSKDRQEG